MLASRQAWVCTLCVVAACLVANLDAEELIVDDDAPSDMEFMFLQEFAGDATVAEAVKGRADYSKSAEVPDYLATSRTLVTASWTKCKLACDNDKSCSGFKFKPMKDKQLPSCQILVTPGGEYIKPGLEPKAEAKPTGEYKFKLKVMIPESKYKESKDAIHKSVAEQLEVTADDVNSEVFQGSELLGESDDESTTLLMTVQGDPAALAKLAKGLTEVAGFKCEFAGEVGEEEPTPTPAPAPVSKEEAKEEAKIAKEEESSKESIMKKYEKAKELVMKAEDTHVRSAAYAEEMRKNLLAVKKKITSGKDQIVAMQRRESTAKKDVINAKSTVKKAKVEVKVLERQEETRNKRDAQELRAKAGKDISDDEKEAEEVVSERARSVAREEESMKQEVSTMSAKEVLEKHLCKKNVLVLKLKQKVLKAELELKYKDSPVALLKQKQKIDAMLKAEQEKLQASEDMAARFKGKETTEKARIIADKKKASKMDTTLNNAELVSKGEFEELETEANAYESEHGKMKGDEKELLKTRRKLREMENKSFEAKKMAKKSEENEKKTKREMKEKLQKEKWKAEAGAAESRKALLMLHKSLTNRRKSLEKDVLRLQAQAKMNSDSRTELIDEFQKLNFEEQHMEREIQLLEEVKDKTQQLHDAYLERVNTIKKFGGAVWLKKHNIRMAVAKFRNDILSLGTYTDKVVKVSDSKASEKVTDYMLKMDQRRDSVIDMIAKQSASKAKQIIAERLRSDKKQLNKMTDPAALLKYYKGLTTRRKQLAEQVQALKANAPSLQDLVSGEYHAISQYTDKGAVVKMLARIHKQLALSMNSTAIEKKKSILQVAHATARLYAHQVAHATHSKYLQHKMNRLNTRMTRVKNDIRNLKQKNALAMQNPGPDEYDHLLNDEEKPKTGSSVADFKSMHGNSWLNPDPVATPAEVTKEMRHNMKNALMAQFTEIAKGGSDGGASRRDLDTAESQVVRLDESSR